jgi:transcriptional regulator with GAF, ATPase, and Fis domain
MANRMGGESCMTNRNDAQPEALVGFEALDVLARALHVRNAELQPTLDAIVQSAVDAIPGARHAGLILVERHELVPQSTTGSPPHLLDLLQQKLKSGPCLEAAERQTILRIDDMRTEDRWPRFVPEAMELGVCSMLCVPLWIDERTVGTLSLYADRPQAFAKDGDAAVRLFATLATLALSGAQRAEQLQGALRNREVIGQAKGVLMERLRITEDAAFALLAQTSQNQNRKLVEVAARLVETGELLGGPD